jgi:hypothetical protein
MKEGCTMKHLYRNVFIFITLAGTGFLLYGQEALQVSEPPIPVYTVQATTLVPSVHYDSLLAAHDSQFVILARKNAAMQSSVAQSLSQIDAQFLLLYLFAAVLAVAVIILFVVYTRLKKGFTALQQMQKEASIPKVPLPSETAVEPLPIQEKTEDNPVPKRRRATVKKPARKKKS